MKRFNDYLLPDVGKCFKSNGVISFRVAYNAEYEEIPINKNNIQVVGEYAFIDKKFAVQGKTYKDLKTNLIKKLFSNDDQIAIILNNDSEMMQYMNDWRDWMGEIAHKIIG